MTDDQRQVRDKLLGNPDVMRRLREVFEGYDFDADPDKASEAVVDVIAKSDVVTVLVKL